MARQKGNSEGSIYYDKTRNKWNAQYYIYDIKTDTRKRKVKAFKEQNDAKKYLDSVMYQKNNPLYIENNGIPLVELMKLKATQKLKSNLISDNQHARILNTIKIIEKTNFSHNKIEDISSEEIQEYFNGLTGVYSNSSIKKLFEQFNQSYTYALNKGYIMKNPMVDVVKPRSQKDDKIVRALTVEEQQNLTTYLTNISISDYAYRNVFLFQMYLGLRIGEALALTKNDVDLIHNLIKIDKTLTTDANGKVMMGKSTKTYSGIRELPIPSFLKQYIIEQMKISNANNEKLFFSNISGTYVDSRNINRMLKKILKDKFNIEGISTHSLRHTYGTRCVEAGMRAVALQRLMGHKDIAVTMNTYTSVFNKYKESELEKVNNYYINNELLPSGNNKEENER